MNLNVPPPPPMPVDVVKNPKHYEVLAGVEVIELIASGMTVAQWKGYCLGNIIKYRMRAGKKDLAQQDIDKASFYVELYGQHNHKCIDAQ